MESSLALYFRDIGQYPLLTKDQELELGRRIKDEGDEEARQQMINCNLRLVVDIAKNYRSENHNIPLEDLIADGNLGLIKAVEKYDYTLGYRFSTCATPWIKQAIMKSIIDKSRSIRIPAHIIQKFNEYKKASEELVNELEREPTHNEIAKKMGMDAEELSQLLQWRQNTASLEKPLGDEEDSTLEDICADDNDVSPIEYTERSMKRDFIDGLLDELDDRTKKIVKLRFGLGQDGDPEEYFREHTLEEIGALLNPSITRERCRQILAQQIAKWKTKYSSLEL